VKLRLTINIGTNDAKRFGLNRTLDGDTVDVSPTDAEILIGLKWAVAVPEELKPAPQPMKAVPPKPDFTSAPKGKPDA